MSKRQITIAIDAMGGDYSPLKTLQGAAIFSKDKPDVNLKLFGDESKIIETISNHNISINSILRDYISS